MCKFANFLTSKGLKKGDRIAIYMPVTIDLVVAMLGAVRIGVIHTVVVSIESDRDGDPIIRCISLHLS